MIEIAVTYDGNRPTGWTCAVTLSEGGVVVSSHRVRVQAEDLDRLAPGAAGPADLVRASFDFLLARESPAMILRSFALTEIARYFPEYDTEIRKAPGPP